MDGGIIDLSSLGPQSLPMSARSASPLPASNSDPADTELQSTMPSLEDDGLQTSIIEQQLSADVGNHSTAGDDEEDEGALAGRTENDDGRSSSLSDIDDDASEDRSDGEAENHVRPAENDSEAETERLENSPHKLRKNKDVILSSNTQKTVERSPNRASTEYPNHQQEIPRSAPTESLVKDDDDSTSTNGISKSAEDLGSTTANTSLEESGDEDAKREAPSKLSGKKRKLDEDAGEDGPAPKKTGSIKGDLSGDADDAAQPHEDSELDNEGDDDGENLSEAAASDAEGSPRANGDGEGDTEMEDTGDAAGKGTPGARGKKARRKGIEADGVAAELEDNLERNGDEADADEAHDEEAKVDDVEDMGEGEGELNEQEAAARNEEERTFTFSFSNGRQKCQA